MINEYLSPNMKRKVLQHLTIQNPQGRVFSKLSDFNASHIGDTKIPTQDQKPKDYDYFPLFNAQVNKAEGIVFGFASSLVERLEPSSMILSFGLLRCSKSQKSQQAKGSLDLPFNQLPFPNALKLYFVLYPQCNHLVQSDDRIQFKVSYPKSLYPQPAMSTQETSFTMKYLPPTHINSKLSIRFKYPKENARVSYIEDYMYKDTGAYFPTRVLSKGIYISEKLISNELWINILYPEDIRGRPSVLENWWKPIAHLDPKSPFYKKDSDTFEYRKYKLDYNLVESSTFNQLAKLEPTDPISIEESITKVFQFCNLLSVNCGLDPYYDFIDISKDGSGDINEDDRTWPRVWPKKIQFKSNANGFRLPTGAELEEFLLQEKQKWRECLKTNSPKAIGSISLDSYFQLTQDAIGGQANYQQDAFSFLGDFDVVHHVAQDNVCVAGRPHFVLDMKKLKAEIQKVSNTEEYQKLDNKHQLFIDPKTIPNDQSIGYFRFGCDFSAKRLALDFLTDPNTEKVILDYKIESIGYSPEFVENCKSTNNHLDFGFRIVKNKM